jgi:hypothetical protein
MGHEAPAFALIPAAEETTDAVVRDILTAHAALGLMAQARLGLGELPPRVDRLAPGMVYGVACAEQAIRVPLLAGALAASLRSGKPCTLITPAAPAILLRKASLAGFSLHAALKAGELSIFQVTREAPKHLFRLGASTLIDELERDIPGGNALVVIDEADALFLLCDPRAAAEAAQRYSEWAAAGNHTVLAAFAPAPQAAREYLVLQRIAENFAGFALGRALAGGALLDVRHWFGAEGPTSRESFELRLRGRHSPARGELGGGLAEPLSPVDGVVCVRGALAGELPEWEAWEEAQSIAEAVDAARRSEAATLLLPYERPNDFEALAHAVAQVRAIQRSSLRVLVRERALRMRASETLALMRLGASSVIPADVPDVAVKRMADALRGTRFARPYDSDLRQVEEETIGLLQPRTFSRASFCEAVERLLAAADGFDVPSCLVVLEPGAAEPRKVLTLARRHAREFVGLAEGDGAWLFWYGCRAEAAMHIMKRISLAAAAGTEAQWHTHGDVHGILGALDRLRKA